ncbi:MAG: zinc dependent phospholipase [Firmicutes bacterium]|nr:zinc dependent phospholipase [Bacillota bacterium]
MNLHAGRANLLLGGSVKLLLAPAGVFQGLIDHPGVVHQFCNHQALVILRNDGFIKPADFFQRYLPELNAGAYWADEGWKNVGHYLDLGTKKGLWRFPTALDEFGEYFGRALGLVSQGDWHKGLFFLGAAAHLVQDLCVPQHARGKLLSGHQKYEAWVGRQYHKFAVDLEGAYISEPKAYALLLKNAEVAADFLNWVEGSASQQEYTKATKVLLERAQRTTAGLLLQFYTVVGARLMVA